MKKIIKQVKEKIIAFWKEIKKVQEQDGNEEKILYLNRILAKKELLKTVLVGMNVLLVIGINYLINSLAAAIQGSLFSGTKTAKFLRIFPQPETIGGFWWLYLLFIFFLIIGNLGFVYKIKASLSVQDFNVQQKGS